MVRKRFYSVMPMRPMPLNAAQYCGHHGNRTPSTISYSVSGPSTSLHVYWRRRTLPPGRCVIATSLWIGPPPICEGTADMAPHFNEDCRVPRHTALSGHVFEMLENLAIRAWCHATDSLLTPLCEWTIKSDYAGRIVEHGAVSKRRRGHAARCHHAGTFGVGLAPMLGINHAVLRADMQRISPDRCNVSGRMTVVES